MMLLKISVRNLFRQKRRNVLLGIGIAFGMSILLLSNAFAHGLSDILLNRVIKWMTGHILVNVQEKPEEETWTLIRDTDRIVDIIQETLQGDLTISEVVGTQDMRAGPAGAGRALGNGAAAFIMVRGIEPDERLTEDVVVLAGDPDALKTATSMHPIILYSEMAENLNVTVNDTIRVRFSTVYGQVQAVQFTVVAILEATNPFISMSAFTSTSTLKSLSGFMPQETGALTIIMHDLNDPRLVIKQAGRLHAALQNPGAAGYYGQIAGRDQVRSANIFAIKPDTDARQQFIGKTRLVAGDSDDPWKDEHNAVISTTLAHTLGVWLGEPLTATYETKFEGVSSPEALRVAAIFEPNDLLTGDMVVVHPQVIYSSAIPVIPLQPVRVERQSALFPLVVKEWSLLEQTFDQDMWQAKREALEESDWQGRVIDVNTMYELASDVLEMERVLDMITLVAVCVLFCIILIGVVNTLRMTIRERTREIGTMRAIGMQRNDVRWSFVLEVVLLAFFASVAGIGVGFLAMTLLSVPTLEAEGMFMMFLVDHHLYFLPTWGDVLSNVAIILVIAFATAFFPARQAAQLSVAEALRHVE